MKVWQGLVPRLLALAGLSTLLGSLLLLPVVMTLSLELGSDRVGKLLSGILAGPEGERCRADPQGWASTVFPPGMARLYDVARVGLQGAERLPSAAGTSAPDRPDPELLSAVQRGRSVAARLTGAQGGILLARVGRAGPCSLLELRWKSELTRRLPLGGRLLGVVSVSVLLATVLGIGVVIRPLLRRIRQLHAQAKVLGQPDVQQAPADSTPDALGELSSALMSAHQRIRSDAEALLSREQALERHLSDVAHDLRTPLTSLQLALEQAWGAGERGELEGSLTRCLEDVVYLSALTENLRLACSLQEGAHPQAGAPLTEAGGALEAVCRRLQPLARRKGIALDWARPDGEVFVKCSPLMLERALANLIHNAIQYGGDGGHVAALLESSDAGGFVLRVLDDGPGVPPEALPRLGTRTFRAAGAAGQEPRGSGLGLAIVASVCQGCGWDLRFALNEPQGLRVEVAGAWEVPSPGQRGVG